MSEKEQQKLSSMLQKAENAARIRLFGKASNQYRDLMKLAESVEPELVNSFKFLSELYLVNQDISDKKDPLETGSLRDLNTLGSYISDMLLIMALPGGVFGVYQTDRILAETRALLLMYQGVRDKDTKILDQAIKHFLVVGNNQLFFGRYVNIIGRRVNGNKAALECEARKQLVEAVAIEDENPSVAIPHYMLATRALRAARKHDEESKYRKILIGLKKVRRCWFCGRLVQGANHFISLESDISPYFEKLLAENKEDLRVYEGNNIQACIPCAAAIYKEADRVANHYKNQVMSYVDNLTNEIQMLKQILFDKGVLEGAK